MTGTSQFSAKTLPLDTLCLINNYSTPLFIKKKYNTSPILFIVSFGYTFLVTCLRFELKNINFVQDSFFFSQFITTRLSCFYKSSDFLIHSSLKKKTVNTLSSIYSTFSWLEREMSELDQLYFVGLLDSRRLLTNYASVTDSEDYLLPSYNCLIQSL